MHHSFIDGPLLRPFIVSALVCALVLWMLLRTGWAWSLATDVPTHRSLHTRPTPRVGGWGVAPASALGLAIFAPQLTWVALLVVALAAICQIDDRRGLSARIRFAVQLAVAIILCSVYRLPLPWWLYPVAVLGLVWSVNLYNFMDGADGLAGGMALIGFGAYGVAAVGVAPALAAGAAAVGGAAAGFLLFNWSPARLFLGDAGSIPLGFLGGSLGLIGWSAGVWAAWFPFMVFSPFILDASITLARRLLRGERFWEAHREHYYQRMIQMDGGHGRTIRAWYLLMACGALLALFMLKGSHAPGLHFASATLSADANILSGNTALFGQTYRVWLGGGVWITALCFLGWRVDHRWMRFRQENHEF